MVYLEQKIRLNIGRVSTVTTSEVITSFDKLTQFLCHQSSLLFRKGTCCKFAFQHLITVQTAGGNTFYIVIDYDKPVDEEGEQYET